MSPERIDADVAIIGAGPAGTAAALHLGQLGVKNVVLLDRHDFQLHDRFAADLCRDERL